MLSGRHKCAIDHMLALTIDPALECPLDAPLFGGYIPRQWANRLGCAFFRAGNRNK